MFILMLLCCSNCTSSNRVAGFPHHPRTPPDDVKRKQTMSSGGVFQRGSGEGRGKSNAFHVKVLPKPEPWGGSSANLLSQVFLDVYISCNSCMWQKNRKNEFKVPSLTKDNHHWLPDNVNALTIQPNADCSRDKFWSHSRRKENSSSPGQFYCKFFKYNSSVTEVQKSQSVWLANVLLANVLVIFSSRKCY